MQQPNANGRISYPLETFQTILFRDENSKHKILGLHCSYNAANIKYPRNCSGFFLKLLGDWYGWSRFSASPFHTAEFSFLSLFGKIQQQRFSWTSNYGWGVFSSIQNCSYGRMTHKANGPLWKCLMRFKQKLGGFFVALFVT